MIFHGFLFVYRRVLYQTQLLTPRTTSLVWVLTSLSSWWKYPRRLLDTYSSWGQCYSIKYLQVVFVSNIMCIYICIYIYIQYSISYIYIIIYIIVIHCLFKSSLLGPDALETWDITGVNKSYNPIPVTKHLGVILHFLRHRVLFCPIDLIIMIQYTYMGQKI